MNDFYSGMLLFIVNYRTSFKESKRTMGWHQRRPAQFCPFWCVTGMIKFSKEYVPSVYGSDISIINMIKSILLVLCLGHLFICPDSQKSFFVYLQSIDFQIVFLTTYSVKIFCVWFQGLK